MDKQMQPLIILGSARSDGNTRQAVEYLKALHDCELLDLNDWDFSYYDYQHRNREDDFIRIIERVLQHDTLIFASPIYWYTMSAVMKNFFDRLSDLLKIHKEKGRQLRGKTMCVISCNGDAEDYPSFAKPFELSADYLGMHYGGYTHTWVSQGELSPIAKQALAKLALQLQKTS